MELEETQKEFPVGLRVLAVDDDRTCLMVLEALLRRCRYNVTATNEGVEALKLLRENKDGFDIVITDVDRPDMDGFKLLELVGLEMDLPVIMLSANCDTQMVMKGIRHGACDYLLKPVRLEEVKNVWQHVIRRRKIELEGQNNSDHATQHNGNDETNGEGTEEADQIEKRNRKRKEHHEDDKSNSRGSSNEEVEGTTRKKPRVLWTPHLHHLFLDAVNQLEFNPGNVVPKRILDLMRTKASQIMSQNITNTNVIDEKVLESLMKVRNLTRENVASHLQKYRNVLRKNEAASRQVYSGLEGKPFPSLALSSLDGSRNNEAFLGPREPSILQRLNETAARLSSSIPYGKNQLHHMQKNTGNEELQQYNVYGNPQICLHQWSPTSFDLKQNKPVANLENVFGRFTSRNSKGFSPDGENCCQMTQQQMKDPNIISSHGKSSSLSTDYYVTDTDIGCSSGLLGFGKETNNLLHNDSLALGYVAENIFLRLPQAEGNICSVSSEPTALTSLPSARTGSGCPCIGSTISGQTATTSIVENQWCFDLEIPDDLKNTLEDPGQDQIHKLSFDNFRHPMVLEHGSMDAIIGSEGLGADIIMTNQLCDAQLSLPSHDSWKWIGDIAMNINEGYSKETSNNTGFDTS